MRSCPRRRMPAAAGLLLMLATIPAGGAGQSAEEIRDEYGRRVRVADSEEAMAVDLVLAGEAARFMRRFEEARGYLDGARALARDEDDHSAILSEALWQALATGGGVPEVQRIFARAVEEEGYRPVVVAGLIYWWPEVLLGGGYDALIERLSLDAQDPDYRCACYATKAWMHRAAGRVDRARVYWDSLNATERSITEFTFPFDEADWRARLARNLARAGHAEEARAELARAMEIDLSAFESVSIRRRRAQTYAELGQIEEAVADLEYLLSVPSPVTVHTLESRLTWAPIREHPLFQALLERHR